MPTPDSRLAVNTTEVAGQVLDGEAVIINPTNGRYYSMDGVGGFVWTLIEQRRTPGEIAASVAGAFGVPLDRATADLNRLVGELLSEKLVVVDHSPNGYPAPAAVEAAPAVRAYEAPELHIFTDMEELLALDPPMPGLQTLPWTPGSADATI